MYQNRVFLIGFTGHKAEVHISSNQNNCTTFSLATASSYKDKRSGEYVKRTEWHRIGAWGKLGIFAASLDKGTHLLVEGELRSHEVSNPVDNGHKRRRWEIRAEAICKLERADRPASIKDVRPAELF